MVTFMNVSPVCVLQLYGMFLRMSFSTSPKPTPVFRLVLFGVRQICASTFIPCMVSQYQFPTSN